MTTLLFQVTLNVPEGSGMELATDAYAGVLETVLNDALEAGHISGASSVEVDPLEDV